MLIREAMIEDIEQLSLLLKELTASGKRTRPDDEDFVRKTYINPENKICCCVADDEGAILGLQSLVLAQDCNEWGVETGWGIIGTHVRPSAARRGVGRELFKVTHAAARQAGLSHIDASIADTNLEGLAYYTAIGFQTYRTPVGKVCKRFDV